MSVVAEVAVPTSSVVMEETLDAAPETVVEVERVVAHPDGGFTPYFWVHGDLDAFEAAVEDDDSISEPTRLDVRGDEALYRAEWPGDVESVAHAVVETDGTIVEATGKCGGWDLRLRFENPGELPAFSSYCEEHGVEFEVQRVYRPSDTDHPVQHGVTPKQREALLAAADAGFYEVPPEATMGDVAETLDISQQALSKRLRRGHGNLVSNLVAVDESEIEEFDDE